MLIRRLPNHRSITLRLVEPDRTAQADDRRPVLGIRQPEPSVTPESHGVSLALSNITVKAGGHPILEDVSVTIAAGAHVAILGASGAGKSSLLGLVLGLLQPSEGEIQADGLPVAGDHLEQLRAVTAWIDPSVQIWNSSLLDNLLFGSGAGAEARVGEAISEAGLQRLLSRLPRGLQEFLGEGGGSLSGGEGQLVRVARAMLREQARLAVLDEPFRGLDAGDRARLLQRCRCRWSSATLLVVTHDVAETERFDQVLVLSHGRLVEHGPPLQLRERPGSVYGQMLQDAADAPAAVWGDAGWTKWRMERGQLTCG
jgi:ATP-binding cassette subfamily B protein